MNSVFKYRTCISKDHLKCLSKREIYFSSYQENRADDPAEGDFNVIFGNIDVDLVKKVFREELLNLSEEAVNERLAYLNDPQRLNDIVAEHKKIQEEGLLQSGVFCVARSNNNSYNWKKFGQDGQGFVVEYDLDYFKNKEFHIHGARYTDDRPSIHFNEILYLLSDESIFLNTKNNKYLELKYLYKPLKYKEEDEVRIIAGPERLEQRNFIVSSDAILSVTIGPKMDLIMRHRIHELCEIGGIALSKIKLLD
jgi:hypothetical protein